MTDVGRITDPVGVARATAKVGQNLPQESAGLDPSLAAAGAAAGYDPAQLAQAAQAIGQDPALAELLSGGGDIEQYLQNYEQMLSQGLNSSPTLNEVDAEGGITVRPEPGFVIKTRATGSGMKVFLNVVSNENVEKPHMKSFAELEGEEGCRVPLSVGTPVEDFDKKQEPCVTYDLVANPEIVDECNQTPAFRDSIVQLCLAAVAQKYDVELDQRFKIPKMKYKGNTVQLQRLRVKKQAQIQEVSRSPTAPEPGQIAAERAEAAKKDGVEPPGFCVYYAKTGAQVINGFKIDWPPPPEGPEDAAQLEYLSGLDLPCYRVNAFQERIRGTMMNKPEREKQLDTQENEELPGEADTKAMLAGRTCIVMVSMPNLDPQVASLKQFSLEVSDECLRISFPLLPRSGRSVHAPLTIWWPQHFCSAQASADWQTETDLLIVTLPTGGELINEGFDEDLLNAMF